MRRSALALALALTCVFAFGPGPARAASVPVDQLFAGPSNSSFTVFSTWSGAQLFTAGLTGTIRQVRVALMWDRSKGPLSISIYNTASNLPAGPALATVAVPVSAIPALKCGWTSVAIPAVHQMAGTQYALVVSAPSAHYSWCSTSPATFAGGPAAYSYDGGSTWTPDATSAFLFATYVLPEITSTFSYSRPAPGNTHAMVIHISISNNGPIDQWVGEEMDVYRTNANVTKLIFSGSLGLTYLTANTTYPWSETFTTPGAYMVVFTLYSVNGVSTSNANFVIH